MGLVHLVRVHEYDRWGGTDSYVRAFVDKAKALEYVEEVNSLRGIGSTHGSVPEFYAIASYKGEVEIIK